MRLKIASQMEAMWRLFGEMDERWSFIRALFLQISRQGIGPSD
jgi:hypothetical protein